MTPLEVYDFCRSINPYVGFVAFVMLCWRLGPALMGMERRDVAARFLFAGYVLLTAAGAWQSAHFDNRPGPASLGFTCLHVGVVVLMLVWKKPFLRK